MIIRPLLTGLLSTSATIFDRANGEYFKSFIVSCPTPQTMTPPPPARLRSNRFEMVDVVSAKRLQAIAAGVNQ
jgi:hypothetical protein